MSISASEYLRYTQNPRCPGAPGLPGVTGPQGPTGPPGGRGPAGQNGIAVGGMYYFSYANQGSPGPTATQPVGSLLALPSTLGFTPNPFYPQYIGFFNEVTGSTGSTKIGEFVGTPGTPSSIPGGVWTFDVSAYSFTGGSFYGPSGPFQQIPAQIQAVVSLQNGSTATTLLTSAWTPLVSDPTLSIPTTIKSNLTAYTVSDPINSYFNIQFYAKQNAGNTGGVFQFWTNGDSISNVITTLPANAGVTGPQGFTGPQGPVGPQGAPGNNGQIGPIGPTGLQGPTGSLGVPLGSWCQFSVNALAGGSPAVNILNLTPVTNPGSIAILSTGNTISFTQNGRYMINFDLTCGSEPSDINSYVYISLNSSILGGSNLNMYTTNYANISTFSKSVIVDISSSATTIQLVSLVQGGYSYGHYIYSGNVFIHLLPN